jgi:hypothetical protein
MQSQLDKFLAENKEYQIQFPTFQDWLTIIQINLNCLQAKKTELKVEYWKVEVNHKSLELTIAMDVCEFVIATERAKLLEKENVNLDMRLCS